MNSPNRWWIATTFRCRLEGHGGNASTNHSRRAPRPPRPCGITWPARRGPPTSSTWSPATSSCYHGSDPATVFLSARAAEPPAGTVEALDGRSTSSAASSARSAMRRTMFVVPVGVGAGLAGRRGDRNRPPGATAQADGGQMLEQAASPRAPPGSGRPRAPLAELERAGRRRAPSWRRPSRPSATRSGIG